MSLDEIFLQFKSFFKPELRDQSLFFPWGGDQRIQATVRVEDLCRIFHTHL